MDKKYALIAGSSLFNSGLFSSSETTLLEVENHILYYKKLNVSKGNEIIVLQRHKATNGAGYFQPHLIKYQVIMDGLKKLKVTDIIGFCSVGSLKPLDVNFGLGNIVIPDDFFCPWDLRSCFTDYRSHCVPELNKDLIIHIKQALIDDKIRFHHGAVYGNTIGPRFETKAEIRFLSKFADLVGMTGAHEATIANELGIRYAMICVIDNWGNGLEPENDSQLSLSKFKALQTKNQVHIEKVFSSILRSLEVEEIYDYDLVVTADYIVTMNSNNDIYRPGYIAVKDGKIAKVGLLSDVNDTFKAKKIMKKENCVLLPGLVNSHTHASMSYLRGVGSDLELKSWLEECIWPIEKSLVSYQYVYDSTVLAIAEMILSGTTCFNDMYFFPEAALKAVLDTGIRAVLGAICIDFPSNYAATPDEYFDKGEKMISAKLGKDKTVNFAVAVHSNYAVSESSLMKAKNISQKFNIPLHIHLHETKQEVEAFVENKNETPIGQLNRIGLLNKQLIAVHMTHLSEAEIEMCSKYDVNVVHCPFSNLKLASGFCQVDKLLQKDINVALGTDGAASNNSLDMLGEIKVAACLGKAVSQKATALPEVEALKMGTINGAKALMLEKDIGSLEVGKYADFICIDLDAVNMLPLFDVISQIVFSASRENVTDVWVGGVHLLKERELTTIDIEKQKFICQEHKKNICKILQEHNQLKN